MVLGWMRRDGSKMMKNNDIMKNEENVFLLHHVYRSLLIDTNCILKNEERVHFHNLHKFNVKPVFCLLTYVMFVRGRN